MREYSWTSANIRSATICSQQSPIMPLSTQTHAGGTCSRQTWATMGKHMFGEHMFGEHMDMRAHVSEETKRVPNEYLTRPLLRTRVALVLALYSKSYHTGTFVPGPEQVPRLVVCFFGVTGMTHHSSTTEHNHATSEEAQKFPNMMHHIFYTT